MAASSDGKLGGASGAGVRATTSDGELGGESGESIEPTAHRPMSIKLLECFATLSSNQNLHKPKHNPQKSVTNKPF